MLSGEAFETRDEFVDARIVFHGAGTQRIHSEINRVIPGGKTGEMANDFDFADFGKTLDGRAGKFRAERGDRVNFRDVERGQFHAALAGNRVFENQAFVLAGVRTNFADMMRGGFGFTGFWIQQGAHTGLSRILRKAAAKRSISARLVVSVTQTTAFLVSSGKCMPRE